MEVHEAFRYRLELNPEQEVLFRKHAGMARFIFNWALAKRIAWWEKNKDLPKEEQDPRLSAYDISRHWTQEKPEWSRELIANVATYAITAMDDAYKHFFRRVKEKRGGSDVKAGHPRFKAKGKSRDAFTIQDQSFRSTARSIKLGKIGMVRVSEYVSPTPDAKGAERLASGKGRYLDGKILRISVCRRADHWYATIMVRRERPDPEPIKGPIIGIDLGLNHRLTCVGSDGSVIEEDPGRHLESKLRKLEHLQRLFQRKLNGKNKGEGKNREKLRMKIAKLHAEIADQRTDAIHKISKRLTTTASHVVVEGFNIASLVKRKTTVSEDSTPQRSTRSQMRRESRRRIHDAAWGQLRLQLEYKSKWYGSNLIVTDPHAPTNLQCHKCGHVSQPEQNPSSRFRCESCGITTTRQINTAMLQLQAGQDSAEQGTSP